MFTIPRVLEVARRPSIATRAGLARGATALAHPRERAFLRKALLVGQPRPLAALARRVSSWERVAALADRVSVLPMLYRTLIEQKLEELVGEAVRVAMSEAYEQNAARNTLVMHAAQWVQGVLSESGVESVLIKGAALLGRFEELGARHQVDVDLLVHRAELERARSSLLRAGCCERPRARGPHPFHWAVVSPDGIVVEVHFGLPDARVDTVSALVNVFERSYEIEWRGQSLRVADDSDLLGIACEHVLRRHGADLHFVPRLVSDVDVLCSRGHVDWWLVRDQYDHHGSVTAALALVDFLAGNRWLAGDPQVTLAAELMFAPASLGFASELWELAEVSLVEGVATTAKMFLPSREYVATRYNVDSRSPHLAWLYLHRLLAPLARVTLLEPVWNSIALRFLGRDRG